jgi:hypothetical protein
MTSGFTIKLTVLATAVAASLVFTISAFAAIRPDDRAGVRGPGAAVATQVESNGPGLAPRPDNRAGVLGIGSEESTSAATSSGFDWTAAGIGAGATGAFVILVAAAAAMLAMPRRQRAIA